MNDVNQVSFFIHDGDGRIRQAGSCPADMVQLQRVPGCQTKIGVADLRTQYFDVKAGEIRDMPPRPSEYHVFDYAAKQWVFDADLAAASIRARRTEALKASDWTQMPDVPLSPEQRAAWAAYRQALRDLPQHPDWPNVELPQPPG